MTSKIVKILGGSVIGLLSLTTTITAGYKVYKNNTEVKANKVKGISESVLPEATPETIEKIENEQEVVILPTKPSPTNLPSIVPQKLTITNPTIKPNSTIIPTYGFKDDEDDEVEFEKHRQTPEPHKTETPEPHEDDR